MDYEKWMAIALNSIESNVIERNPFEVKDLFEGHRWKALNRGNRIGFGRYFANEVKEGRVPGVSGLERGKDNHSRYIKQQQKER
ncbi:DUF1413 domain-containing protein [Ellagibacter isourolithinifaciens]|uniref:DUF1413 domain-containing protein n=1 Tax=Ellagibacter isourolithinifaciens TaxID=2137581 RepID=UPI002E771285|nr:DUF1413 domain-containing protein [Ellagibacter isourolithinifaciens]MEE0246986.1 DUF1413 domain-containing protein [Ellagibacter isourolithinifaciens]